MNGCFIGIHRDFRMRKSVLATVSFDEFNTLSMNSKLSKVVSYIQDNKSWERIYVILKRLVPCLRVIRLADNNKAVIDKVSNIPE